jgi:hypothetical protein
MDFPGETVTGHRRCRSQVAFVDLDLDGNELGGAVQWSPPLEVSAVQALCNRYPWDTLGIPLGYPWANGCFDGCYWGYLHGKYHAIISHNNLCDNRK